MTWHSLTYGTNGVLFAYAVNLAGFLAVLMRRHVGMLGILVSPIVALPTFLATALGLVVVGEGLLAPWLPLGPVTDFTVAFGGLILGGVAGGLWITRAGPGALLQRGTAIFPSRRARRAPRGTLTLAGVEIPPADETKHFKLIRTTGTGKSTGIRELLRGALARGDRAVIADPDGSYLKRFFDPQRGDRILNPFDDRAGRWDLFAEITQPHDADQLARSLIPDYDGTDRSWRHYARTFLTAVMRQLHRVEDDDLTKLYYLLLMAPPEELRDLLEPTPAGPLLGQDNGKFFQSVRSITNVYVAALEHLAAQTEGEALSVRHWIREGRGVLFLPYRASEVAALRHIVSTWMRLAIFEAMNAPEGDQRLWFIVDELDALGAMDGLKDALARLRKFGARCMLGFQSIAQVRGSYGDAEAQTIVENCGTTLILRCSASERGGTAEFASRLIGRREIIRRQVSHSRGTLFSKAQATATTTDHYVTEDAVMASEIEQLPDLTDFLKVASRPEWRRVRLTPDAV